MSQSATETETRQRPERSFAGLSEERVDGGAAGFGTTAPIVLPEGAKPRPDPAPSREELEELGRRTASVAHDFNNLLSVIMVCAGEIVEGPDDGTYRERAQEIRDAAERGAELSRRLLTGSGRVDRPADDPAPIATTTAIIGAMKLIERMVGGFIDVSLASDGHLPEIRLAPGEIERVLLNLAANSRDAMPNGGRIEIRTGVISIPPNDPRLGTGWHVRIAFADNGSGMPPETARMAIEPYFSTKGASGSGLGLASVAALVRGAGGDVRVNSRIGAGTTISIYLPALDTSGRPLALPGRVAR